jgi:PKD repeat protein
MAFLLVSCSGGTDLLLPGDGQPAGIEVADGNGQSGRVGEPLHDPLIFEVTDSRGRAVEGAQVVFSVAQAGPGAAVVPDTATTDADGKATAQFQLGTTIGTQGGEASVVMPAGSQQPKTTFTATALSENANEMALLSGDGQSGPAGSALGQPLAVQVTDAFGNPISGVPINWSVEGGGTVSESLNLTDDQGTASVIRTLGPAAGPQATIATSEGLAGSPVTFTHTATAGSASLLSIVSGDNQTAVAGSELPGDLVVRLVDAQGNGVPDAAVTWVVGTGGGRVSPENTTTDEAGRTSARWTLGNNPGQNRADAVVSGVAVVHFQATGTSGAPSGLVVVTQPSSSTQNAAVLQQQPVVQVRAAGGADVHTAGIAITAQLAGGGGELLGTRQLSTDGNGRVAFTNLAIAGAQGRRTLVFTAVGYAGATSSGINVLPIPTTTTITGDSPDPSAAGALVTVSFRVSAAGVTPLGDVTVTDGDQSCTGTLNAGSGSCQLPLTNAGPRTLRATYRGAPGLIGSSGTAEHQVTAPPPGNRPPTADFHWNCDGLTCHFTDASSDGDGQVVSWSWNFGDNQSSSEREPSHTFPAPGTFTVTLTIADNDGAGDQASAQVNVKAPPPPPPNKPPHADFDVSCQDLTCTFTDRSTDDDGTIQNRVWDYGDGNTGITPSHTYASAAKYHVTLTVTDDDGATNSRTKDADAKAPAPGNQPPHAEFTVACPNTDLSCTFTDQSTDTDGSIASRSWDYGDGNSGTTASHTYQAAGTYHVTLTVTDNDGATDSRTHDANPKAPAPNQAPHAEFTVACPNTDLSCTFTDQSTDTDGTIASRSWDYGDGNSGTTASHTYPTAGTYHVTLTVTDNDGATNSQTHDAHPTAPPPPNQPPQAEFTIACTDLTCNFTDQSTDNDGSIASLSWDYGDGNSGTTASHTYQTAGTYHVTLTVTDNDGATDSQTHDAQPTAPNAAPVAQIGLITCTGTNCQFHDASTDPDGSDTIQQWSWVFDDGNSSQVQNPSHEYAQAGDYTVKLTVTDDHDAHDTTQQTLTIAADTSGGTGGLIARGHRS